MADIELNKIGVKSDSLPNDWYVSLINPKAGQPAEIMTIARFIELLPFLLLAGGELTGTVRVYPSLEIKGKLSPLQFNNNTVAGGSFNGIQWSSFDRKEALFSAGLFTSSNGEKFVDAKYCIGWGPSPWNMSNSFVISEKGVWYKGQSLLTTAKSADANELTETIREEVPVSVNSPMTLQEDGQPVPATQTVEYHEYSISKMGEAILELQKQVANLKA
ncbi:hypothetical protein [Parabacteroides goldsteinii]|uniref:hypothetical protein n=1 Tax=Parabacteroides goldsteinii TaxID=328812 RepID=UPI00101BA970|nr:hypothetical protein [Parabacteroides goldsteinii]